MRKKVHENEKKLIRNFTYFISVNINFLWKYLSLSSEGVHPNFSEN